MNIQNLMSQLMNASNPLQMMMGMLNPNQKQMVNMFQGKNSQEQADAIAKMCNEKGITKDQLKNIMNMLGR